MINGLVDLGGDGGINFSLGGGVGFAHTKYRFGINEPDLYINDFSTSMSRSQFAWQLLAEARYAVSPQIDLGLKYRYFNGGHLRVDIQRRKRRHGNSDTKFRSHSTC